MADRVVSSRDWRRQDEPSSSARWSAITILALVILGLVGFLIYSLLPPNAPNVALHMLGVPDYSTDLPGVPFVQEDWELFQPEELPLSSGELKKERLEEPGEIENLAAALTDFFEKGDERDIALIYISAHGISRVDLDPETEEAVAKPFLLGSTASNLDYTLASVEKLLTQIQTIKADTKVILLDTAHMGQVFGLGMGANEFVFQLHRAMSEIKDQDLWVIHSTGMLQHSHISYREQNSVFAKAVKDAFQTLGDPSLGKEREHIFLADFYLEIAKTCLVYAPKNSPYMQTPILMRGGTGVVVLDPSKESRDVTEAKETLVFYRNIPQPETEEGEEDSEKSTEKEGDEEVASRPIPASSPLALFQPGRTFRRALAGVESRSSRSLHPQEDSDGESAQESAGTESSPDEDDSGEGSDDQAEEEQDPLEVLNAQVELTELQKHLNRVLVLRDRLATRSSKRKWTPVDFAPFIWDQILLRLARLDERAMFVTEQNDSRAFRRFQAEINGFESDFIKLIEILDNNIFFAGGEFDSQLRSLRQQESKDLLEAWQDFGSEQAGQVKASWEEEGPQVGSIVRSMREYHDVLNRLKYYELLYEDLSYFTNPGFDGQLMELVKEVKEKKTYFQKTQFGNTQTGLAADARTADSMRDSLINTEKQLRDAIRETFREQVEGRVAIERTEYLIAERLAIIYLRSPLIPMLDAEGIEPIMTRSQVLNFIEGLRERSYPKPGKANEDEHWATLANFVGEGFGRWNLVQARLSGRKQLLSLASEQLGQESSVVVGTLDVNNFESSLDDLLKPIRKETLALRQEYRRLLLGDPVPGQAKKELLPFDRRLVSSSLISTRMIGSNSLDSPQSTGVTIFSGNPAMLDQLRFQRRVGEEIVRFVKSEDVSMNHAMTMSEETIQVDLQVDNYKATQLEISVDELDSQYFEIRYRTPDGSFSEPLRSIGESFKIPVVDFATQRNDLEENTVRIELRVKAKPGTNQAKLSESHHLDFPTIELSTKGKARNASTTTQIVRVKAPLPEHVDLIVTNKVTDIWEPSTEQGRLNTRGDLQRNAFPSPDPIEIVQVHPFTNRFAPFEMRLVNRSGVPIEVRAELYEVRRPGAFPGLGLNAYPLLPGSVSDLRSATADRFVENTMTAELPSKESRFMPAMVDETRMKPFAVSQLLSISPATSAFPSREDVFGESDSSGSAAVLKFGQPITIPGEGEEAEATTVPNEPIADQDVTTGILCRVLVKGWKGDEVIEQLRWIEMTPALWNESSRYIEVDSLAYSADARRIEASIQPRGFAKSPAGATVLPWEFLEEVQVRWVDIDPQRYPNSVFDQLAIFDPKKRAPITRRWIVPDLGENGDVPDWPVWFDVDGYPRLLHYRLNIGAEDDQAANWRDSVARCEIVQIDVYNEAGLEEPSQKLDLRNSPLESYWIGKCDHLVVHYEIDGPMGPMLALDQGRLTDGNEEYISTFTRDSIRQPENVNIYYLDRDINYFANVGKTGDLELSTTVADLQRTFKLTELKTNSKIPFVAELKLPNDVVSDTILLGIDLTDPKLQDIRYTNGSKSWTTPINRTVSVRIQGQDEQSGIYDQGVDLYLNLERNTVGRLVFDEAKKLDVRPAVVASSETNGTKEWEWLIVPDDLKLKVGNNYTITARIRDKVGLESKQEMSIDLTVGDAVTEPEEGEGDGGDDGPKLYDVELQIFTQIGSADPIRLGGKDIKMKIEGPTETSPAPGEGDYDRILRRLAPGSYKIEAEVEFNRRTYVLEKTINIPTDEKRERLRWKLVLPRE